MDAARLASNTTFQYSVCSCRCSISLLLGECTHAAAQFHPLLLLLDSVTDFFRETPTKVLAKAYAANPEIESPHPKWSLASRVCLPPGSPYLPLSNRNPLLLRLLRVAAYLAKVIHPQLGCCLYRKLKVDPLFLFLFAFAGPPSTLSLPNSIFGCALP